MNIKPITVSTYIENEDGSYYVENKTIDPIFIYVLFYESIPVYVGQSNKIESRINNHNKNGKIIFDKYSIISHYFDRDKANTGERAVISAMKLINRDLRNKNNTGYSLCFSNNHKSIENGRR